MNKSSAAFRQTEDFVLPQSGITVQIKKPDLLDLALSAKNGEMPSFLRQQVIANLNGAKAEINSDQYAITIDNAPEYHQFINRVCKDALVWPVVVDANPNVDNGEILISDIDFIDRFAIVTHIMPSDSKSAATFPTEQGGGVELPSDVQELQLAPVGSNGHHQ